MSIFKRKKREKKDRWFCESDVMESAPNTWIDSFQFRHVLYLKKEEVEDMIDRHGIEKFEKALEFSLKRRILNKFTRYLEEHFTITGGENDNEYVYLGHLGFNDEKGGEKSDS